MPWSSQPTSDFLRWTQFILCDLCLLIFDSKKRLQYLNLLNHHTTYSYLTKKTRGMGIKTILEDFDNNPFSGGRTRSAKDSTQFEPLGLGGRNEAWPQSGLRQIWQSCQSFWHSKFAISCLDYLHTTFKILTFKHPYLEAATMFSHKVELRVAPSGFFYIYEDIQDLQLIQWAFQVHSNVLQCQTKLVRNRKILKVYRLIFYQKEILKTLENENIIKRKETQSQRSIS